MKASSYIRMLLFTTLLIPVVSLADDYLDALKSEAGDLEYLDESRPGNVGHVKKQNNSAEVIKASANINQFEKYFKLKDPASAAIYLRLNTAARLRIYRRFKSTHDLNIAKKMTFNLYQKQQ